MCDSSTLTTRPRAKKYDKTKGSWFQLRVIYKATLMWPHIASRYLPILTTMRGYLVPMVEPIPGP